MTLHRTITALLLLVLTGAAQAGSRKQYTFDNTWERARERLQLLEDHSNPYTFEQLEKLQIQEGWICLDAGAGYGGVTRWLADKVGKEGRVDALDMEAGFLRELNLGNVRVIVQNLVDHPLPIKAYDLVFARDVLMHIPQRADVIKKFVQTLKPGGILVVEDLGVYPNRYKNLSDDPEVSTTAGRLFDLLTEAGHASFLSAYDNPALFEQAGLVDITASGFASYEQGGLSEGKVWGLCMVQLKPLLVNKMGVNEALYEKVHQLHMDKSARWWGVNRIITIGMKPL